MTPTPPVNPRQHAPKGPLRGTPDPMKPLDPMDVAPFTGGRRCSAHGKHSKRPCKNPAIKGGTVCRKHGGGAPQVQAKAQERLMALQHPAIDRLTQLIAQQEFPSVAIAAVRDVLDRTLGKPIEQQTIEHSGGIEITWKDSE